MAVPTTEQVLIGVGLTPAIKDFNLIVEFFTTYADLKVTKFNGKKLKTRQVYEIVGEKLGIHPTIVESACRKTMNFIYKKTKYKYLFKYFNLELETEFKPTTTELANLLTLIERDRRRELQKTSV